MAEALFYIFGFFGLFALLAAVDEGAKVLYRWWYRRKH